MKPQRVRTAMTFDSLAIDHRGHAPARAAFTAVTAWVAMLLVPAPARAQDAPVPHAESCTPKKVAGDGFAQQPDGMALTPEPGRPTAFVNWDVRWRQRHRLWITLSATNPSDADVELSPALLLETPGADRRAGLFAESSWTLPPHATLTRRLSLYLPDDAKTAGVAVRAQAPLSAPVQVSLAVACSDDRFDPGEMDEPAAAVLEEALKLYFANAIDPIANSRVSLESARSLAAGAHDSNDVAWAMRALMNSLHDTQSFFVSPGETPAALSSSPSVAGRPLLALRDGGLAYLRLAPTGALTDPDRLARAQDLHVRVAEMQASHPRAWIIDLREQWGPDFWPELAALSPLLGGTSVGADVDRQGSRAWIVDRGVVRFAGEPALVDLQLPPEAPFDGPIALLLGPHTADAGEDLAVAFNGRPRTRSFGAATAGFPATGVRTHALSDGSVLGIVETRAADRNGVIYRGPVSPDELLDADSARAEGAPQDAVDWALNGRSTR